MRFDLDPRNDRLIRRLEKAIHTGKISHAYLIEGGEQIDKEAFAHAFAKGILCPKALGENCGQCSICGKIDHDNMEDLVTVRRKSKTNLPIAFIRQMQAGLNIQPVGQRHIVIIADGDLMNEAAQNCLLKTLEEPPGESVLMILSQNMETHLPTSRSRCVKLHLEGSGVAADSDTWKLAQELLTLLDEGAPYYRLKKATEEAGSDRDSLMALLDVMEELYRERFSARSSSGVPLPVGDMERAVYAMEDVRRKLDQGMTPRYLIKNMVLNIGG
ncbi:MAG: hypothetical protein Q4F96_03035 [Bacillota bacterium]|nr:hypothetical protein [Bacillota bacterium]